MGGALAVRLGLVGVVDPDDLRALIDGCHPGTGERIGAATPPTVRAIDATFSAPKSVSLLWAFGTPQVAAVVSIAHVEAVEAALGFVERTRGGDPPTGGRRSDSCGDIWVGRGDVCAQDEREATLNSTLTR